MGFCVMSIRFHGQGQGEKEKKQEKQEKPCCFSCWDRKGCFSLFFFPAIF